MKLYFWIAILLLASIPAQAGLHKMTGRVTDTTGTAIDGASVSLLYPADSTLAFFAISNPSGGFSISDVREGTYVLQVAMMGYYTEYMKVDVPSVNNNNLGAISLKQNVPGTLLSEVIISGEKVPVRVLGDTLEYNAGSYKVKPDAMVEDLLRKLPGVQVDNEGNIKAMGKDVSKVLVDGKEFFGNDPKMATRNLPADAIDKIQAFEKKSDESLFTGVDDGSREQTLNLKLKDGKKTGYFGEAMGALGTPDRYDASLRAFKFRPKSQLAALGMFNNINKFGFSFGDYLNFNGGLSQLMQNGGQINLDADDAPVDFGQAVTGDITSGAAGLNYSIEPWAKSKLGLHYMGNGARKLLEEFTNTRNYTPQGNFVKDDESHSDSRNSMHRLSASFKSEIDSVHMLTLDVAGKTGGQNSQDRLNSATNQAGSMINTLNNRNDGSGNTRQLTANAGWLTKRKGKWQVLQGNVVAGYTYKTMDQTWQNSTTFMDPVQIATDNQYRNSLYHKLNISGKISAVRSLGKNLFLVPSMRVVMDRETNNRMQGPQSDEALVTDSLSQAFSRSILEWQPGLQLRRNRKLVQWNISLEYDQLALNPYLNGTALARRSYRYLLPSASWQKDLGTGQRLSLNYRTDVNAPSAGQLLPVKDYRNPLLLTTGNADLKPEYKHDLSMNYNRFDQFSMSSFFVMLTGQYTRDKIDWNRVVRPDLGQELVMANTPYAAMSRLSAQYARPIRKLGIHASLGFTEMYNRSVSMVNAVSNTNSSFSHVLDMDVHNLNNDVLDVRLGGRVEFSSARYSINRELNNNYINYSLNARVNFRPSAKWNFLLSGDLTQYTARSFDAPVTVPLLRAEVSRYIFPNQRGTITLRGFDLLDKNRSVQRSSQLNYLMEQRSNVIGRYFMLSFAYKLNRSGNKGNSMGGIEIH